MSREIFKIDKFNPWQGYIDTGLEEKVTLMVCNAVENSLKQVVSGCFGGFQ